MNRIAVAIMTAMLAVTAAYAQTMEIYGHVRDAFTKAGIPGTKVTIMRSDSSVIDTGRVYRNMQAGASYDATYSFVVEKRAQTFIIKAEHPDYETCYVDFNVRKVGRNTWLDAPWHYMTRLPKRISHMDKTLDEVTVKATRVQFYYNGDTIVFNADAFNVPEGSMLDALIRQMPGVELKDNGEILVNGRKVDNLTLGGKDFFKGNNLVMLRNLPHYTVHEVKVYDDDTEYNKWLGRTEDEKELKMDVVLKREYSVGFIGNATAGGGTGGTWLARLFMMRFSDNSRMVAFGNDNNIGQAAMAYGDEGEWYTQDNRMGNTRYVNGTVNWICNDADNTRSNEAGIQVGHTRQDLVTRAQSENYLAAGNTFGHNTSENMNRNFSIMADNRFCLKFPFRMVSDVSAVVKRTTRDTQGTQLLAADVALGDTVNFTFSRGDVLDREWRLSANNDFDFKTAVGDVLHLNVHAGYESRKIETFAQDSYRYRRTPENDAFYNRYDCMPGHNFDVGGNVSYGLNWDNAFTLKPYATVTYNHTGSDASYHRLDLLANLWNMQGAHELGALPQSQDSLLMALDLANSYENTYSQLKAEGGVSASFTKDFGGRSLRVGATLPVSVQHRRMDYRSQPLTTTVSRDNTTFSPSIDAQYAARHYQRYLVWRLRRLDVLPALMYLVDRRSDSNPLAVQVGNPDLKMSHTYSSDFSAQLRSNATRRYVSLSANYATRRNAVVTGYEYDPATGRRTYRPTNINGMWNTGTHIECGTPLDSMDCWFLSFNGSYGYDRVKDVAVVIGEPGDGVNTVNNHTWSAGGYISFTKGKFTADFNGIYRRRHILRHTGGNQSLAEYDYGFNVAYTLPGEVSLSSKLQMYGRRGYEQSHMNDDDLIWNATLARSFLRGNRLTVTVTAHDILGQVSNISYSVNAQGRTETWRNTITRYVMLTLTYRFNRMPRHKS